MYSCHLFLISSASVRSIPFLSFTVELFLYRVKLRECSGVGLEGSLKGSAHPFGAMCRGHVQFSALCSQHIFFCFFLLISLQKWQLGFGLLVSCCPCMHACMCAKSCPTLCDPMDCSLPGYPVLGIFQARILDWVAISSSK